MQNWIKNHLNTLRDLQLNAQVTNYQNNTIRLDEGFEQSIGYIKSTRAKHTKLMMIGNGGSAGIASHLAIDFSKNGKLPAMAFNDSSALTCLANDYGYEHVFAKQIEFHGRQDDVLVAISSSGKSINILNAVAAARKVGCHVITFSGFQANNPLSKLGDVNFYVDSKEYGFVEVSHVALLHSILDYILEEEHGQMNTSTHTTLAAVE